MESIITRCRVNWIGYFGEPPYREGFINIDGSNALPRVDKVIDVSLERLTDHFAPGSVDYILAQDIVEHHFHWEAAELLRQFHALLRPGGALELRTPDCEYIIHSLEWDVETKLTKLYGGQDVAQGVDAAMDESRKKFPQYFCHKYGWTMRRMHAELRAIGFDRVAFTRELSDFRTFALK